MYNKNMMVAMSAYNSIEDPKPSGQRFKSMPSDNNLDVRDILSSVIVNGSKSMSEESVRAKFAGLAGIVGLTKARKLIDHALVYNQTGGTYDSDPDEKLRGFFNTNPADADVKSILTQSKSLGDGVVPGYGRSPYNVPATDLIDTEKTRSVSANLKSRTQKY